MAIKYLNNISLELNELQNFKVDPKASEPTGTLAQMYFNTTTDKLRIYTSTGWEDVDSGSMSSWTLAGSSGTPQTITNGETATIAGSTFINSVAGATDTVTLSLSATGTPSSNTFLRGDNTWATPAYYSGWTLAGDSGASQSIDSGNTATFAGGNKITTVAGATDTLTINHDTTTVTPTTSSESPTYGGTFDAIDSVTYDSYGHITGFNTATVTLPSSDDTTYDLTTAPTGTAIRLTGSDATNDDVTISGTTNEVEVTRISGTELRVGLPDDVTITGELTVSGTGQSSFGGQVTVPATPSANTDAASKGYVDNALAGSGALIYQGGYNAATNTPDLDSSPSSSIKKGWTYTVTADGTFFTEQVRVGDVLIAEQDAPTTLGDWTTVQNNVDLADLSTVGIGNVNAGTAISVSYSSGTATVTNTGVTSLTAGEGIDVSASTGAVTVSGEDSSATNKGIVIVAGGTGISVAYASGTATVTNSDTNSSNTFAATLSATGTVTHNLGTRDVIVQLYDVSTYETVYADVERATTNTVTVTFASIPTNSIRVLVQKIG